MITIEQCRAARGLLGWTQQDLADACGLSKTAINNFEKAHSDIKTESLRAIRMAFESLNIEFIGKDGLRRSHDHVDIIKGASVYSDLIDDILLTLTNQTDELLIIDANGYAEPYFPQEKLQNCIKDLAANGIKTRIIKQEDITNAQKTQHMSSLFIYSNKFSEQRSSNPFLTVITSQEEAGAMRQKFEVLWNENHATSETQSAQEKTA